jgi:hypothetical protein
MRKVFHLLLLSLHRKGYFTYTLREIERDRNISNQLSNYFLRIYYVPGTVLGTFGQKSLPPCLNSKYRVMRGKNEGT